MNDTVLLLTVVYGQIRRKFEEKEAANALKRKMAEDERRQEAELERQMQEARIAAPIEIVPLCVCVCVSCCLLSFRGTKTLDLSLTLVCVHFWLVG